MIIEKPILWRLAGFRGGNQALLANDSARNIFTRIAYVFKPKRCVIKVACNRSCNPFMEDIKRLLLRRAQDCKARPCVLNGMNKHMNCVHDNIIIHIVQWNREERCMRIAQLTIILRRVIVSKVMGGNFVHHVFLGHFTNQILCVLDDCQYAAEPVSFLLADDDHMLSPRISLLDGVNYESNSNRSDRTNRLYPSRPGISIETKVVADQPCKNACSNQTEDRRASNNPSFHTISFQKGILA